MLRIPLLQQLGTQETKYLDLNKASLPSDVSKLVYLLQREKVPIEYWHQVAVRLIDEILTKVVALSPNWQ